MTRFKADIRVPRDLLELINTDKWLVQEQISPALRRCVPLMRRALLRHLPDGRASGTRALQSAKSRERFPNHMKDHIASKQVKNAVGALQMVGLKSRVVAHVNFDHGDKAKTLGRKHVLWGAPWDANRAKPPALRRQMYDIPERVANEVRDQCIQIVVDAIAKGIAKKSAK